MIIINFSIIKDTAKQRLSLGQYLVLLYKNNIYICYNIYIILLYKFIYLYIYIYIYIYIQVILF